MRYQQLTFSCGAGAVVNALRALGVRIDERRVRTLASTTTDGTDEIGVMSAVRGLGHSASEFSGTSRNHAWRWLHGALLQGSAVIISVDSWSHWVTCIGLLGDRVILIDPAKVKSNMRENGIHVLSKNRLIARWRSSRKARDNLYQAICVSKAKK